MDVLASAASVIIEPQVRDNERRSEIEDRLAPVMARGGPVIALQPIVDLATGRRAGAEALSRFPAEWGLGPDVVFEQAHSVGLGHELELQALRGAAALLDGADGYVAMNVSPATLLTPGCADLLSRLPLHRVLLELSEHDPVEDYDALIAALAPFRAAGLRLAIDDVGAGFSSLRHIVVTTPDVIKIDRSIVSGLDTDPVLATLVRSLVEFARGIGATVVAEGVETADEAQVLRGLDVDLGQGWHFGRPAVPEAATPVPAPDPRPRTWSSPPDRTCAVSQRTAPRNRPAGATIALCQTPSALTTTGCPTPSAPPCRNDCAPRWAPDSWTWTSSTSAPRPSGPRRPAASSTGSPPTCPPCHRPHHRRLRCRGDGCSPTTRGASPCACSRRSGSAPCRSTSSCGPWCR